MPSVPTIELPIIDLGPFVIPGYTGLTQEEVLDQLAIACSTIGCFYLKNHGIDCEMIKNCVSDLRSFFDQPEAYKTKYIDPEKSPNRGYIPFESQNINAFMGREGFPNDPVERFFVSPPEGHTDKVPEHLWPDQPLTFKASISNYYTSAKTLSETMMKILGLTLKTSGFEDFVYDKCINADHRFRVQMYPADAGKRKPQQNEMFAAHRDSNPFGLLVTDACMGSLQVFDETSGSWIPAPSKENMIIMNLGDPFVFWTNGHWKAPLHKVTWPNTSGPFGRMSIALFVQAHGDVSLASIPTFVRQGEKAKYESMSYATYVQRKLKGVQTY